MAEDTRLAEACLLLNYSNQSYQEQLIMNQQKSIDRAGSESIKSVDSKQDVESISDQFIERTVTITSPIASRDEYNYTSNGCIVDQMNDLPGASCLESPASYELAHSTITTEYPDNKPNSLNREPINNLLAAVNCALPNLKSRPIILQRSSAESMSSSKPTTCPVGLYEHDYCQQDQASIKTTLFSIESRNDILDDQSINPDLQSGVGKPSADKTKVTPKLRRKQKQSKHEPAPSDREKPLKLVAVHLGAGNSHNDFESIQLAKTICEEVMLQLPNKNSNLKRKRKTPCHPNSHCNLHNECQEQRKNSDKITAESAVVQLIKRLEDHQVLNCGFGSNLNIRGQVECDASLMCDKSEMWAGIGAVSGCKNPILLAKSLYDHRTIPRPLGLIQPNILVGSGAKQWMREHCPHLSIVDSKMVTSKAFSTYQKLKSKYDTAMRKLAQDKMVFNRSNDCSPQDSSNAKIIPKVEPSDSSFCEDKNSSTVLDHGFYCMTTGENLRKASSFAGLTNRGRRARDETNSACDLDYSEEIDPDHESKLDHQRLDTVGAIAVDCDNNFASAISSGGLLLKYKGRIGQAAIPGAGCWAEDCVAVTTTGVGEYLTLNMFAMKFYDKMKSLRLLYDLGHLEKRHDLSDLISCGMDECFEDLMRSNALSHVPPKDRLAGMLSVCTLNSRDFPKRVDDKDLYLSYGHNTNSMCVGYMTCNDTTANSVMSRCQRDRKDSGPLVKTIKFNLDSNEISNASCGSNG